jgi:hypothetical protein
MDIVDEINDYCIRHGIDNINDLRGIINK